MEIFILFMIGAVGAFWWLNHVTSKKLKESNNEPVSNTVPTPVVEEKPVPVVTNHVATEPVVSPVIAETTQADKEPAKHKSRSKKPTPKAVVKKPRAAKVK